MRSSFHRFFIVLFCGGLLFSTVANAQLIDEVGLDSMKTFRSLEAALKKPLEVYKLDLTGQKLKAFPAEILTFKNLNVLVLDRNKITSVPDEIEQLQFLQKVSINKNKLDHWPLGLTALPELRELSMNRNFLPGIPDEIRKNKKLERLDLWSNDLIYFPAELGELKNLKWLDVRVIQMSESTQERIQSYIPNTKVEFDPACNCNF